MLSILEVFGIKPHLSHSLFARLANAGVLHKEDIVEDTINGCELLADLMSKSLEVFKIRSRGAKSCPRAVLKRSVKIIGWRISVV